MTTITKFIRKPLKVATCKARKDEVKTKSGLSYSPAQMQEMTSRGMAVSSANLETKFYDGEPNPSWNVDILLQKGIDPAEIWEKAQLSKVKLQDGKYTSTSN